MTELNPAMAASFERALLEIGSALKEIAGTLKEIEKVLRSRSGPSLKEQY